MNSSMSANPSSAGGADAGQNENENHLIGNILAEEDENSGKSSQSPAQTNIFIKDSVKRILTIF